VSSKFHVVGILPEVERRAKSKSSDIDPTSKCAAG